MATFTTESNDEIMVQIFLNDEENLNIQDENGNTSLHNLIILADGSDKFDLALLTMLNYGADPDLENNNGDTPKDLFRKTRDDAIEFYDNLLIDLCDNAISEVHKSPILYCLVSRFIPEDIITPEDIEEQEEKEDS
jgi:ankyrin repeat protein